MKKFYISIILILIIFVTFPVLYLDVKNDSKEYQTKVNSKKTEYLKKTKENLIYLTEKYSGNQKIELNECLKNILDIYTTNDLLQIYYLEKDKVFISQYPEYFENKSTLKPSSMDSEKQDLLKFNIVDEVFLTKNQYLYRLGITLNHPLDFLELLNDKNFILNFILVMFFISILIFIAVYLASFSIEKKLYYKLSKSIERPKYFKLFYKFTDFIGLNSESNVQSGILALNKSNETKEAVNKLLRIDIPSKILKDIIENKANFPVVFKGIIAGPDINGYTSTVKSISEVANPINGEVIYEMSSIVISNKLKLIASELVLRYGGKFASSQGDNAVSIFENTHQEALALSYCRDVMKLFSEIEFVIDGTKRKFTLKSSLVRGVLKFEKDDMGTPAVNSISYAEYNRLLGSIKEDEKERNILVLEESYLHIVKSLIQKKSELLNRTGKNLPYSLNVYFVTDFCNIDEVYKSDFEKIHFFRLDEDIIYLLKMIRLETDSNKIDYIINGFTQFKTNKISSNLVEEWISTLNFINSGAKLQNFSWKTLSAYIETAKNLISNKYFTPELIQALFTVDNSSDDRTVASVADVFNYVGMYEQILNNKQWFLTLNTIKSSRLNSEFVKCNCLRNLGEGSLKDIRKLLSSRNLLNQKSGLYVAYTVIEHHLEYNIDALYVMEEYSKIVEVVKKINPDLLNSRMKFFRTEIIKSYDNVFN